MAKIDEVNSIGFKIANGRVSVHLLGSTFSRAQVLNLVRKINEAPDKITWQRPSFVGVFPGHELTAAQRGLLIALALHPNGTVLRDEEEQEILMSMVGAVPVVVDGIHAMASGGLAAHITPAGRACIDALELLPDGAPVDPLREPTPAEMAAACAGIAIADMPKIDDIVLLGGGEFTPVMFHYAADGTDPVALWRAHGFVITQLRIDDCTTDVPEALRALMLEEIPDPAKIMAAWNPEPPEGWKLVGKWHGEDGPVATFMRPIKEKDST